MRKNSASQSAFTHPRLFIAFLLCFAGAGLAVIAFAQSKDTPAAPTALTPIVRTSVAHGTAPSVLDVADPLPRIRTKPDRKLPRVKPAREVPPDFIDQVLQDTLGVGRNNEAAGPQAVPGPIVNFEGMNQEEGCGGCLPPDTTGAVGPTQYVQMVNSAFSVYSKNGTRLSGPTAINQLFQSFPAGNVCKETNNGDPIVVYDQLADRWLLSQFAFRTDANGNPTGPWDECIAVTQGPDATGPYYIYDFHLSNTKFHDYPHIGLWPDAYYMATHLFIAPDFNYGGAAAVAFERDKMLAGQPAKMVLFDLGTLPAPFNTTYGGHLPANLDGFTLPPAGAPNYFVEVDNSAESPAQPPNKVAAMRIWEFHVDWATPANSTFGLALQPNSVVQVADFARPPCSLLGNRAYVQGCVPQLGDPGQLDPIGDRLMYRVAYRNFGTHEAMVFNHTVVANATTGQMGPRWYEVRDPGGTPTVTQQSTFGPLEATDPVYRFMGSIALDRGGNIAIGYSASSAAQFPSINYNGRLVGDPPNTLAQGETVMHPGGGPQHGEAFAPQTGRWGDYTTMTVDPVDDCTFWYTNEYYPDAAQPLANWHTRVGSFKFAQCTPRPTGILTGTVTESGSGNPILGAKVRAVGGAIDYIAISSASGVYQFSPLPPGDYTVTATAQGYFASGSFVVTVTAGGTAIQNFELERNLAEPTPAPPPLPNPLQKVNPPVLNDPGATITTNSYSVSWSAAEVTTGLTGYVVEESTDYVVPLFDHADGSAMPGDAASLWTRGEATAPWTQNPAYRFSPPFSYAVVAPDGGFTFGIDSGLTLKSNITIAGTVGSGRLTFYTRYHNGPDDTGNVDISKDNGTSWISLRVLNDAPLTPPADTRVQKHEIDLTPYKGLPIKLRFRFDGGTTVNLLVHTRGWWVDDINVDGATWTQIGTTAPDATSLNVANKPNGRYYYRVRGVYEGGSFTANSNVHDIIVNAPTGAATPTPTPSPAASATPTATPAATPTATPAATPSATPAATPSATPAATPSATPAATPSATPAATPSATPAATPSATPAVTPSATPAATPSATPAATPSATPAATPSATPAATPSATPAATPSATPAATPVATPIASPTATPTATPGASPSATPGSSPTATPTPTPTPAQLLNISTRARVLTGDNILIGGFIIDGSANKRVILLAKGPSLNVSGIPVPGRMANPTLELHDGNGALLTSNDDWKDSPERAQIEASGFAPSDEKESAILRTLAPGVYTGVLAGKDNSTGIALIEVYDRDADAASILANISSRGHVDSGDNVMIGGFIAGHESGNTKVLIRGIGPSLQGKVPGPLADPVLELRGANGAILEANDNWEDSPNRAEIEATGIPPSNALESAIIRSVAPQNYTAILRGNNGSGIAVVEIYNIK